jgi:methionyl-tRNA formyltransferase
VKVAATEAGVDVLEFARGRDPALGDALRRLGPEVCVVVAYGSILPGDLLEIPRLGFVNLHFSLLPAYRGAAPVQRAVLEGVAETGVSVMVVTEGMDEGPVLARAPVAVDDAESAGELGARLATIGAPLLVRALEDYASGAVAPVPQDHAHASYAPKISTQEALIDWTATAARVRNLVRACNPEPGAWTSVRGVRIKVFSADLAPGHAEIAPGSVVVDGAVVVGTGDGRLALGEVQVAGRRRMPAAEAARGLRLAPGDVLGGG